MKFVMTNTTQKRMYTSQKNLRITITANKCYNHLQVSNTMSLFQYTNRIHTISITH